MGRPLEELAGEARRDGDGVAQAMVRVLSLCHTVVIERMDDGSTAYQVRTALPPSLPQTHTPLLLLLHAEAALPAKAPCLLGSR